MTQTLSMKQLSFVITICGIVASSVMFVSNSSSENKQYTESSIKDVRKELLENIKNINQNIKSSEDKISEQSGDIKMIKSILMERFGKPASNPDKLSVTSTRNFSVEPIEVLQ